MALSEKIKEIIGALTDSLNPMNPEDYEEEMENGFDAEYPVDKNVAISMVNKYSKVFPYQS